MPLRASRVWQGVAAGVAAASLAVAQPLASKATTVASLLEYTVFFHGARVAVLGQVDELDGEYWLEADARRLRVVGDAVRPGPDAVELRGTFWDVGRLQPDDPRVSGHDFGATARRLFGLEWPRVGELLVLVAESAAPAGPSTPATLRSIVLDPAPYEGTSVDISGRFRGRNLYGDLPRSPGRSRWDFVLQSADAAIWVTGRRPRGDGFNLDVSARLDTNRWLRVTGVLNHVGGLTWVEAADITLGSEPEDTIRAPIAPPPVAAPAPEVIFSAPVQGEPVAPPETDVRIQFSRDMNPKSFAGQVRISYLPDETAPPATVPEFRVRYLEGNRVLQLQFAEPLAPFRRVRIELLDGITSFDDQALQPWELVFTVGG